MNAPPGTFGRSWDMEIVAQSCAGICRFDELQGRLGISRKVLAERLKVLVAEGILARHQYQSLPDRYEYCPTEKGSDLVHVIAAMATWAKRWHCVGETAQREPAL